MEIDCDELIKALECCIEHDPDDIPRCNKCPYHGNMKCVNRIKWQALELLKRQKPKKIVRVQKTIEESSGAVHIWAEYSCPECKAIIFRGYPNTSVRL